MENGKLVVLIKSIIEEEISEKRDNLATIDLDNFDPDDDLKKLRIIFPKNKKENKLIQKTNRLGLTTGKFSDIKSMNEYLDKLIERGIKVEELVIGSHGNNNHESRLLTTEIDGAFIFNEEFLDKINKIITPSTNVLFTACNGADSLRVLKDAAEKLNSDKVYGITGLSIPGLNKLLNKFKRKIFSCNSKTTDSNLMDMTNVDLLQGNYCKPERTHPIKWLRVKK